jgi:hypothetical protein
VLTGRFFLQCAELKCASTCCFGRALCYWCGHRHTGTLACRHAGMQARRHTSIQALPPAMTSCVMTLKAGWPRASPSVSRQMRSFATSAGPPMTPELLDVDTPAA